MLSTNENRRAGDAAARQKLQSGLTGPADNNHPTEQKQDRDLTLAELRHVSACLRFVTAEVDMIGAQLRCGVISVEQAQWMVNHLSDPSEILRRATS